MTAHDDPLDVAPEASAIDRSRGFDPGFSLARHLTATGAVAAALAAAGAYLARDASPAAFAWVPLDWFVANLVEWTVHRYPMHRPMVPRVLYRNHTLIHHRAFRGRAMTIERVADLGLVMMPWYTLLLVFAGASPLIATVGLLFGRAHAGVFLLAAVAYFLAYETIHTLEHLPVARLGILARPLAPLRAHHHHHHQLANMARVNFNVTLPVADRLLGTYERSGVPWSEKATPWRCSRSRFLRGARPVL